MRGSHRRQQQVKRSLTLYENLMKGISQLNQAKSSGKIMKQHSLLLRGDGSSLYCAYICRALPTLHGNNHQL